jgi:ferredoxin
MQPYMDFSDGFCLYDCHSCSKACPTGAINFISGKVKRTTKIGTAIFNPDLCVVKTDGTDCAACGEHCPVQAIEMLPYGKKEDSLYIPHVHADVCIGCGACEHLCPSRPFSAIYVEGHLVHKTI